MIQKLGKYTIVEKLGEGAMGAVYKAYDEILGRYVAIKTMAEDIKWDQELKLRFYREARSAAGLQHPNIVIIHDLGEDGKITYIVMELLEGKDLKIIIKEKERIPLETKLSVMIQVADGINHAHLHGIIHRDIKPGNIHVTPSMNVKILDFGIARIPSSDLTRSGVRLGTPVYMSPEQIRGSQYDERSDIFSAGIVFYEFLTYVHPFRDKNIVKTMDNILFLTQFPFAEQLPEAPPGLWPILETCIAKEPDKRYGSMADVSRACRRLLEEMNSSAQRLLAEIQDAAPRVAQAAERSGASANLLQLAGSLKEALRADERPSYATLTALHAALDRESLLHPAPVRPQAPAPPREAAPPREQAPPPPRPAPVEAPAAGPDADAVARASTMFSEGRKLLGEDRPEEALDMLRQAIGILGPKEEYVQMLAQARRRIEERKKTRVAELLKSARESLAAGRFPDALESVCGVLELEPDRSDAIDLRRQALAGAEAEKARTMRQDQADRDKAAGFKLLAEKKFREGLRALQRARDILGDDTAIRLGIEEAEEGIRSEELKARIQSELNEALQLFQADALDKARARVDRVLEMSPRNAEALELSAKIDRTAEKKERAGRLAGLMRDAKGALDRKSYEEAAVLASEALNLDPDPDSEVSRLLAEIARQKESTRRAEEVRLLLKKTEDALDRLDFDEAELHGNEALKVIPDHPVANELVRKVRLAREERRRKQELNEIIAQAQHAFLQGSLGQSEAHARRALAIDPENTKARDMIRRIEAAHDKARKDKVAALIGEAEKSLAAGDAAAALSRARDAMQADPQNADAAAFLRRVTDIEQERKRSEIAALLADSRNALNAGEFERAKDLAQQVLALEDANRNAKGLLKEIDKGSRAARKQKTKEQKRQPRAADSDDATSPLPSGPTTQEKTVILPSLKSRQGSKAPLWIGAAVLLLVLGGSAGIYWMRHRARAESPVAQSIAEARARMDQSLYDDAIGRLQRVLQDSPGNAEATALLAEAQKQKRQKEISLLLLEAQGLRAQDQLEQSRKTLQKILQIDPANEPALAILSQLDAQESASKSAAEQEMEVKKWLANAAAFIGAGKLAEAKAELDKAAQLKPETPEIAPLRRQIAAKTAEAARKQKEQQTAVQKVDRTAEVSRKAEDSFRQGKYADALAAADQWLAEDGSSGAAQALKNRAGEAAGALKAYESAFGSNNFDEALAAVARLEKANPADPSAGELRKRAETRKASARATVSVLRLAEAGSLMLDDQPWGVNGEVESKAIPAGRHKITVKTARGHQSTYMRDFLDGENISLVYDADLRLMTAGDRDLIRQRATRETVYRYTVEHTHGFLKGKCNGDLRISGVSVEYQGSEKEHSFSIPFRSLKLSVNNDKVEFVDVHGTKYSFKVDSNRVGREIKDRWDKLEKMK